MAVAPRRALRAPAPGSRLVATPTTRRLRDRPERALRAEDRDLARWPSGCRSRPKGATSPLVFNASDTLVEVGLAHDPPHVTVMLTSPCDGRRLRQLRRAVALVRAQGCGVDRAAAGRPGRSTSRSRRAGPTRRTPGAPIGGRRSRATSRSTPCGPGGGAVVQRRVLVGEVSSPAMIPKISRKTSGATRANSTSVAPVVVAATADSRDRCPRRARHPMSDRLPPPGSVYGWPRIVMLVAPSVLKSSTMAVPLSVNEPSDFAGPVVHPAPKPVWRVPPA